MSSFLRLTDATTGARTVVPVDNIAAYWEEPDTGLVVLALKLGPPDRLSLKVSETLDEVTGRLEALETGGEVLG